MARNILRASPRKLNRGEYSYSALDKMGKHQEIEQRPGKLSQTGAPVVTLFREFRFRRTVSWVFGSYIAQAKSYRWLLVDGLLAPYMLLIRRDVRHSRRDPVTILR